MPYRPADKGVAAMADDEARDIDWTLTRGRVLLLLRVLLIIALLGPALGLLHGKEQFTAWLFLRQDIAVVLLIMVCVTFFRGGKPVAPVGAKRGTRWLDHGAAPWAMASAIILFCWLGHVWLLGGHDLTRDEQMANFDAALLASGRLFAVIPDDWRPYAEALNQTFMLPIAQQGAWASNYLPGNAVMRALFDMGGAAAFTGPVMTGIGAIALWSIARRLWPDDAGTRWLVLLLYAGSSQVITIGMTAYAMPAHLALNLVWLALFLRGGWAHGGAILAGALATGLHQPIFHPLFVAPFLIGLVVARRWRLAALYGGAYAVIGLFWLSWPLLVAHAASGGVASAMAGEQLSYIDRIGMLLSDIGPASISLMAMNLLRFIAWQHLLLLPLLVGGVALAWRAPLVRPLAAGIGGTILVIGILLAYQGHGWGYRYLHGLIGSACIIAGHGWAALPRLRADPRIARLGHGLSFAVLIPLHLWMVASFTRPYADADRAIAKINADVVVIDDTAVAFGADLVINRPDLDNRPIRLMASALTPFETAAICGLQSVTFMTRDDLVPIAPMLPSAGNPRHMDSLIAACAARSDRATIARQ